jgi:hypothetical protein
MDGFAGGEGTEGNRIAAMLYHRWRPCANPGRRLKMTKQRAIPRLNIPSKHHG